MGRSPFLEINCSGRSETFRISGGEAARKSHGSETGITGSTEDIANFVDQALIFQILIFNCRELFQQSALLTRQ